MPRLRAARFARNDPSACQTLEASRPAAALLLLSTLERIRRRRRCRRPAEVRAEVRADHDRVAFLQVARLHFTPLAVADADRHAMSDELPISADRIKSSVTRTLWTRALTTCASLAAVRAHP